MTLKNNRAPLLCYFKLCVSFRSHWWIQTWVTVRKCPIWVKFDDFFNPCNLEIWWMTLNNNRAPLLCYLERCASFHSHWRIQAGALIRRNSASAKFAAENMRQQDLDPGTILAKLWNKIQQCPYRKDTKKRHLQDCSHFLSAAKVISKAITLAIIKIYIISWHTGQWLYSKCGSSHFLLDQFIFISQRIWKWWLRK